MRIIPLLVLCLAGCSVPSTWLPTASGPLPAQFFDEVDDEEVPEALQDPAQESKSSRNKPGTDPNRFNFAAGVKVRDGDAAISLAGTWEYRINDWLGVGALADYAASPFETLLVAPAAWMRPTDRLTLLMAPGWEFESSEGTEEAVRLGVSYDFPLGRMSLTPLAYWDLVENRSGAVSIGIAIGGQF